MGCTSDQYASLESYLVRKARICKGKGYNLIIGYNNVPKSNEFIKDLKSEGAHLYKLEANTFFDLSFCITFSKIVKNHKIDVLHAYFAPTRHYAIIAAWLLGIKKRYRQCANMPLANNRKAGMSFKLFSLKHQLLSWFATKYICRSNAVKHQYEQLGLNSNKLRVADGGTDTERYKRKEINRKDFLPDMYDNYLIGTASRLVKGKGIDILIDAVELLILKGSKIVCLILGDGPERGNLEKTVNEKQLNKYVLFLGHKSNLEDYYNLLDIFISASFSEGMSNSILEALACERPVIVSDIEPNKEIINVAAKSNLYIGEVFRTGNKYDLAEKIELLLSDKNRGSIGEKARTVILNNYSVDERIIKEIEIYQQ
jgi:glycosyltransferase involved in cell wall biosynthesis